MKDHVLKKPSALLLTILWTLVFELLNPFLFSQTIDTNAYDQYTFIKKNLNRISNDSSALSGIYEKLYRLEQQRSGVVSIAHIGDSHIQADHMSGLIRQKLQLRFGNAGRGLVFPYRAAKSNEPVSYRSFTNVAWDFKRNVFPEKQLPIGLCGFTIETKDTAAELHITFRDQPGLGYRFTRFSLFHEKSKANYQIIAYDELNCEIGTFGSEGGAYLSTLRTERPLPQIILRNKALDTSQHYTRIYGMIAANDSSGVLYHTIGVNGAEFRHYNASEYFIPQFSYLDADLVIISLGTNEAFAGNLDTGTFYKHIDSLVNNIKRGNPDASFLFTTPGDSFRRSRKGRIKNPNVKLAKETIIRYCLEHNIAYWDLYEIMGGYGSMAKWYAVKIAARDRVHFSGRGYQIQGDLLYRAFMEGFEKYKKIKMKEMEEREIRNKGNQETGN